MQYLLLLISFSLAVSGFAFSAQALIIWRRGIAEPKNTVLEGIVTLFGPMLFVAASILTWVTQRIQWYVPPNLGSISMIGLCAFFVGWAAFNLALARAQAVKTISSTEDAPSWKRIAQVIHAISFHVFLLFFVIYIWLGWLPWRLFSEWAIAPSKIAFISALVVFIITASRVFRVNSLGDEQLGQSNER